MSVYQCGGKMIFFKGLMLGLASGVVCVAYCAPILVPYLLGGGQNILKSLLAILCFMSGRLAGYLMFAVIAQAAGQAAAANMMYEKAVFGVIYIILAGLMIVYGFKNPADKCAGKATAFFCGKQNVTNQQVFPIILGFLTGLNLCPPFLIAFTEASQTGTLLKSMLFFAAFFVGTSVYILPMAVLGLARRSETLRYIGRMAAAVMGVYYLYLGILSLRGGFI
jgi:sulfite exporter TauE/SafE